MRALHVQGAARGAARAAAPSRRLSCVASPLRASRRTARGSTDMRLRRPFAGGSCLADVMRRPMGAILALVAMLAGMPAAYAQSRLVVSATAQTGMFVDVGDMNPHSYRTNELFSNDWVYEVRPPAHDGASAPGFIPAAARTVRRSGTGTAAAVITHRHIHRVSGTPHESTPVVGGVDSPIFSARTCHAAFPLYLQRSLSL